MLTKTQEKILGFLLRNTEEQITIRGLAKRLKKSYTLVYNNLKNLEKKEFITKQSVPPAIIIRLHEHIPPHILIDIELKIKRDFLIKYSWVELMYGDILKSVGNPFFIFMIFGSYAKETQTKRSDIDLLIITQNKKQIKESESIVGKMYSKIKKNIIIVDMNDFKEMISQPNVFNVGNEAKKHHIILYGVEQYYQIIKR